MPTQWYSQRLDTLRFRATPRWVYLWRIRVHAGGSTGRIPLESCGVASDRREFGHGSNGQVRIEPRRAARPPTDALRVVRDRGTHGVMVDADGRGDGADLPTAKRCAGVIRARVRGHATDPPGRWKEPGAFPPQTMPGDRTAGAVGTRFVIHNWRRADLWRRQDRAARSPVQLRPSLIPGGRRVTSVEQLTRRRLSYKMSYMRKTTVSVRELQQNLKRVMARVERGETVEVTRRRRPVARLAPVRPAGRLSDWPDLDARARAVFGDRIITPSVAEAVIENRGDR